jgi:hypothetical protein
MSVQSAGSRSKTRPGPVSLNRPATSNRLENPMNNAVRARQRILAVALPITAALYIAAEGVNPKGTDQVITTTATALKVLPIAARHSTQLYISGSLSELALGAVAVSYAAIAILVRRRAATWATIAVLVGGIGAFCGAVVNVLVGINLAAAASSHLTQPAAAQFLVASFNSGPGQAFLDFYALGQYIAPVLMGVALWRSRSVPRWLAVLFLVGFEVAQQVASVGIIEVLFLMAPFAVAMVLLAVRIWQTPAVPSVDNQELSLVAAG